MMSDDHPSRAGRLTALTTLAVSAVLFVTALAGIATIDPGADAPPVVPMPATESISLDAGPRDRDHRDCPWRDRDGASDEAPAGPRNSS